MPSKKRDNLCIIDNLCVFLITCAFLITSSFLITWIILITRLDGFFEMTSIEITEFKVRVVVEDSYEIVPSKPDTDVAAVLEFLLKQLGTRYADLLAVSNFPLLTIKSSGGGREKQATALQVQFNYYYYSLLLTFGCSSSLKLTKFASYSGTE